jgi:Ras-related protein
MVDESIDAFLVVYSCTDKESFQLAVCLIDELRSCAAPKSVPIVLVANKNDLVRSRTVSEKGEYYTELIVCNNYIGAKKTAHHDVPKFDKNKIREKENPTLCHQTI